MRALAPAKLNLALEVLGRRGDGYHEVRTIMQTVGLCDELTFRQAASTTLTVEGPHSPSEDDLIIRAAQRLAEAAGVEPGAAAHLRKEIPVGSGLGGGSSDAAATLRGLNALWGLRWTRARLSEIAARLGSDATFFLYGGIALAEGRGEQVTPLPDMPRRWLLLVVPPITISDKTRRMYHALTAADFSDGSRTEALAEKVSRGQAVSDDDLCDTFERLAYHVFEGLSAYREAMLEAGAQAVHLAGAGPGLFSLAEDERAARDTASRLQHLHARVYAVASVTADEATALRD